MLHHPITADPQNRPVVRVATAADAPFVSEIIGADASDFMARAYTVLSKNGGLFFEPITSSVFEAHIFYRPEGRGTEALHAARAAIAAAFDMFGAVVVFGRVPVEDRPARIFTRMVGLRSDGVRVREPGGPLVEWFEIGASECLPL